MKKWQTILLFIILLLASCSSEKISPNAVDLDVSFTWEGIKTCNQWNPEIKIEGIPNDTKLLSIGMYDHAYRYDHGIFEIPYNQKNIIAQNTKLESPCPPGGPGKYKLTVKAIGDQGIIIGIGSKERYYPEKE